ncbi:hypothetical protein [Mucilaginibacter conchicola]|uniref:hypothetical protein n=1 Tax=Mucilaginibacter conchicola TaxID=2303333 RepID=UPI001314BEA3|nr:hypothetical protein [Mucilaginibacter conchicola]
MKKIIIAAALVLTSAVTAYSLSNKNDSAQKTVNAKEEISNLKVKVTSATPKSDIATAD